jgi:type VI secretion system secreted protein VgrG
MGGAEWISKNYINSGQNTLYKMRWNPDRPGTHQYATDVAWASKQAKTLKNMFSAFPNAELSFEFPIYQDQSEPTIKFD